MKKTARKSARAQPTPRNTSHPEEPETPSAVAFPYRDYVAAQEQLRAAAERGPFYGSLVAASGMGKTSLGRGLAAELDRHRFQVVYIAASRVTSAGFARHLAQSIRAPVRRSTLEMGRHVTETLRAQPAHVIVWVDEAERLPIDTLTEIRTLAEFDDCLPQTFSVVLAGTHDLMAMIDDHRLFALKRRISVPLTLTGLGRDELDTFLTHRFGSTQAGHISPALRDELFERSRGTPAIVDTVVRHALRASEPKELDEASLREAFHVLRL